MVTATDPAPPPPQSAARARASKTEILRVSRGRLREPLQPPAQPAENKRKRPVSSRENSLESLLETEEAEGAEDCEDRESLGTRPWRQR